MFVIFYDKQSSEVLGFRHDLSTNPLTAIEVFARYLNDENKSQANTSHAEITFQNLQFDKSKYLYNKVNNIINLNPDYIEPIPQESTP
jgi:hypothetical protein